MRAADFFVTFGTELRDNEIAFFVGQKEAITIFDDERRGPAHFFATGRFKTFPDAFAGVGVEAAELAVAAHAVNVAAIEERRAHDAVQTVGVPFTLALAAPEQSRRRLGRIQLPHHRALVE